MLEIRNGNLEFDGEIIARLTHDRGSLYEQFKDYIKNCRSPDDLDDLLYGLKQELQEDLDKTFSKIGVPISV